jgi:diguanylate cyclase (GGDEF)-like protein
MMQPSTDPQDPQVLIAEINALRAHVARLEQRIEDLDRLAHFDCLVPLPNRRGFIQQLEQMIARVDRFGDEAALLFVDVDGLKAINDSFGHHAGDAALIHVAAMLVDGVRHCDCVARFGGDEFTVLLERADPSQAFEAATRLTNIIAGAPFLYDGQAIPLSVAIGVTEIVAGDQPEAVLIRADRAMYEEKAAA